MFQASPGGYGDQRRWNAELRTGRLAVCRTLGQPTVERAWTSSGGRTYVGQDRGDEYGLVKVAAKRSKDIDDALAVERRELEKRDKMIKVLLLGQSESGKSTTLKSASCVL